MIMMLLLLCIACYRRIFYVYFISKKIINVIQPSFKFRHAQASTFLIKAHRVTAVCPRFEILTYESPKTDRGSARM